MVALQNDVFNVLRQEGVDQLELEIIVTHAQSWADRAENFNEAKIPVMLDTAGVFYIYSADSYDMVLIDKKGRLVSKEPFNPFDISKIQQRIRELYAE